MSAEVSTRFGQPGVLWMLASAENPLTIAEIHDRAPVELGEKTIRSATKRLWRRGFLVRRKRTDERGNPYEYAFVPMEWDDSEVDDGA